MGTRPLLLGIPCVSVEGQHHQVRNGSPKGQGQASLRNPQHMTPGLPGSVPRRGLDHPSQKAERITEKKKLKKKKSNESKRNGEPVWVVISRGCVSPLSPRLAAGWQHNPPGQRCSPGKTKGRSSRATGFALSEGTVCLLQRREATRPLTGAGLH